MSVRCAKCGEELLGAVNRCWKCGQMFARRPDIDGQPPVRLDMPEEPLEAVVVEVGADSAEVRTASEEPAGAPMQSRPAIAAELPASAPPQRPVAIPPAAPHYRPPPVPAAASEIVDARRHSLMAMGGTVASLVLAVFALIIAPFRFEAAVIAVIGLFMGIWGLYSPRRGLALAALLLCCLGIAIGTYTGMRALYFRIKQNQPVTMEDAWEDPTVVP